VAAREDGGQQFVHNALLPHNDLADLGLQFGAGRAEPSDQRQIVRRGLRRGCLRQ